MNEVVQNKNLKLDVFAYDLNEPDLIDILVKRKADEAVPYLWFLTTPGNPPEVRRKATEALTRFLNEPVSRLPPHTA